MATILCALGLWVSHAQAGTVRETALDDVSCVVANNCFAVGGLDGETTISGQIRRWDGAQWSSQTVPAPSGAVTSTLTGVSCTSSTFCMASGTYRTVEAVDRPYVIRWNGSGWSLTSVPVITNVLESATLEGVGCTGTVCLAVGRFVGSTGAEKSLALRWNGTAWVYAWPSLPAGATASSLSDVSCYSGSFCRAVGKYTDSAKATRSLISTYTISSGVWSTEEAPTPSGAVATVLTDVACPSICFAVGSSVDGEGTRKNLILKREATWTIKSSPPTPDEASDEELLGVSCDGASYCQAVGERQVDGAPHPTALYWVAGKEWANAGINQLPDKGKSGGLRAVACPTASCFAVGFVSYSYFAAAEPLIYSGNSVEWSISESGTAPTREWSRIPPSYQGASLVDTSCTYSEATKTRCVEVGSTTDDLGMESLLIRTYSNGSPSDDAAPQPPNSSESRLRGVICLSATWCMAVGSYLGDDEKTKPMALRWDGTQWVAQASPAPAEATAASLQSIACASSSGCMAVGSYTTPTGVEKAFALRWNGTSWLVESTYGPAGALSTKYSDVWCQSATSCRAVGASTGSTGIRKSLVAELAGGAATITASPNPAGSTSTELLGLSCTSASACSSVGKYVDAAGASKTLAERWNGTSWSLQATPNPEGGALSELTSVACTSSTSCVAVGSGKRSGTVEPLVQAWNGTAWSELTATEKGGNGFEFAGPKGAVTAAFGAVACVSSNDCHAVGRVALKGEQARTYSADWLERKTWKRIIGSRAPEMKDISCPAVGECISVGRMASASGSSPAGSEDRGWVLEDAQWSPLPEDETSGSQYYGLDCVQLNECMLVGSKTVGGKFLPLAVWWDGTGWTELPAQDPGTASGSFSEVTCLSSDFCVAVGSYQDAENKSRQMVQIWNGSAWSISSLPTKTSIGRLSHVDCVSQSDCTAVGYYSSEGTHSQLLRWNGTSWSVPVLPAAATAAGTSLTGVDCLDGSFCMATGTNTVGGVIAAMGVSWNGSAWKLEQGPSIITGFSDVVCNSTVDCIVVGYSVQTEPGNIETRPLALAWNGTKWKIDEASRPAFASYGGLTSVDCASDEEEARVCMATGSFTVVGNSHLNGLTEPLTFTQEWSEQAPEEPTRDWSPQEVWTPESGLADSWCTSVSACFAVGTAVNSNGISEAQIKSGTGSSWSEVPTPLPAGATDSGLSEVTCATASACMAVGSYTDNAGTGKALAMQFNGTSWSILTLPAISEAVVAGLSGVACASATSCQAVGSYLRSNGEEKALALQWNGVSWTQASVPMPSGGLKSQLSAVACSATSNCVAVGTYVKQTGSARTLVSTWNGTSWTLASSPNIEDASGQELTDVACTSATACLAVGGFLTHEQGARPLTMKLAGGSWTIYAAPTPDNHEGQLSSVSCPSATACFGVGVYRLGAEALPMALSWNGTAWSVGSTEALAKESEADVFNAYLSGVSCVTTSRCVATGAYSTENSLSGSPDSEEHGAHELTFVFEGATWARPAAAPFSATVNGVSCPDADTCIGVGAGNQPNDANGTEAQAWRQYKGSWSPMSVPSPAGKALYDVACSTANACSAVGAETEAGNFSVYRWNGTSWSAQTAPVPSTGANHTLNGVSCPTSSACSAVGDSEVGENEVMRAVHWNGTAWSASAPAAPSGAVSASLKDVACPTASICVAVGAYLDSGKVMRPLIRHWNGAAWSAGAVTAPAGAVETKLVAVSCSSSTACTAVGSYKTASDESSRRSFAVRWNGTAWTTQTTPSYPDTTRSELSDVFCLSASECVAAGSMLVLEGESTVGDQEYAVTLGWDGAEWTVESATVPNGAPDAVLGSIGCASKDDCLIGGNTQSANVPLAMVTATVSALNDGGGSTEVIAQPATTAEMSGGRHCRTGIENEWMSKEPDNFRNWLVKKFGIDFIIKLLDRTRIQVVEGMTSTNFCWKGKRVIPKFQKYILNYQRYASAAASTIWEKTKGDWVQDECLPNRRKCIGKFASEYHCCKVLINGIGVHGWHVRDCAETEMFSPKLHPRHWPHERNIKDDSCRVGNAIASSVSDEGPPDGDRFGVFRPSNSRFFLTSQLGPDIPAAFRISHYGLGTDIPLVGDWNGDGQDSYGVFRPSEHTFWMTDGIGEGPIADYSVAYGNPSDLPVVGDWNCDGIDTPGVFRPSEGRFWLSDSLTSGISNHSPFFGLSGDKAVVGDWDGDGCDSVGVFRQAGYAGNWYLSNGVDGILGSDYAVSFGLWGDRPVTGDWDDDGDDTFGIFRPKTITWDLRNSLTPGPPNHTFRYGNSEDKPLTGNWDG